MKKLVFCFAFSAAMAALTSCGKIDSDSKPDKIVHELTTSAVTTGTSPALETTAAKNEKKRSYKKTTATEAEAASPVPVVKLSAANNSNSNSGNTVVKTLSSTSGSGSSGATTVSNNVNSGNGNAISQTDKTEETENKTEFSPIAGNWVYQQLDAENIFWNTGHMNIKDDGSYEFFPGCEEDGYTEEPYIFGQIVTEYYYDESGNELLHYCFYDEHEDDCFDIYMSGQNDPDVIYYGRGGSSRMVRDGHTIDDYCFRELADIWNYQEIDRSINEYVTLGRVDIDYSGNYTFYPYDGSEGRNGKLKLEYETYPDGTSKPFYAFYDSDGNIWTSCLCDQIDTDRYYAGNGGTARFERINATALNYDFSDIADIWEYQKLQLSGSNEPQYITIGLISVDDEGYYTYISEDGTDEKSGKIRIENDEYGLSEYVFYDYGQYSWISCNCITYNEKVYELNNEEKMRLNRYSHDKYGGEEFIGEWADSDIVITMVKENDEYNVWVSRLLEEHEDYGEYEGWEYICVYDVEKKAFVCDGDGLYMEFTMGYERHDNLIYSDGSAIFRIKGDEIIWENTKENTEMRLNSINASG